jgi:hypothetical protein
LRATVDLGSTLEPQLAHFKGDPARLPLALYRSRVNPSPVRERELLGLHPDISGVTTAAGERL